MNPVKRYEKPKKVFNIQKYVEKKLKKYPHKHFELIVEKPDVKTIDYPSPDDGFYRGLDF